VNPMRTRTDGVLGPVLLCSLLLGAFAGCGRSSANASAPAESRPKLAFVTNCVAEFWSVATCGVEAGKREFDVDVTVHMPPKNTVTEQKQILEDLLARGVQGIALSPIDPANMTGLLDRVAAATVLITHDSDAPDSKRLCYIGMDNYDAGRLCGELIEEAIPQGGPIVILVGNLDQDNSRRRRQGIIDRLLQRSHDPTRFDAQNATLRGGKFEIRATFTDQTDGQKGKAAAEDALVRWPDLACMVGLFEYEPPLILEAVKAAGKLGKVAIVAFDENEATLQGIVDGHIHGTVVQNPYEYGHRSVELLSRLVRERDPQQRAALLPAGGFLDIPARQIRSDNVRAFWDDLKQKTGKK
jgi:ribose transport system substrate-binding protein